MVTTWPAAFMRAAMELTVMPFPIELALAPHTTTYFI